MQMRNLIVPIVGDFAGSRALRTVGEWVRARQAAITALYTSNVEQYLFQDDRSWTAYYDNVAALPTTTQSTFIRAHFPSPAFVINSVLAPGGRRLRLLPSPPSARAGPFIESYSLIDPVHDLLAAYRNGHIRTYRDVIERSK
jgi:hypothetical protein